MRYGQRVFVALVAAALAQAIYYYPRLPESVASHFGGGGAPNGWSSRAMFLSVDLCVTAMLALVFLLLPRALGRLPVSSFSLPNRDYWLAPERRDTTIAFIEDRMAWFGAVTMAFMVAVMQMTIQANHASVPRLSQNFWWIFGGYMVYTGIWTVRLIVAFYRTGESPSGRRE